MGKEATSKIEMQKNGREGGDLIIDGFENKITSPENMKLEVPLI